MDLKRRLSLVVLIMTIALVSGHLTQTTLSKHTNLADAKAGPKPVDIVLVAAGRQTSAPAPLSAGNVVRNLSFADAAAGDATDSIFTLPNDPVVNANFDAAASANGDAADACTVNLDLAADTNAMIAISLSAPCQPNQRVVLRQAGLAVTGKTSAAGELFATLPALSSDATVTVRFSDDRTVTASLTIPEAARLRRFGVQWLGNDAFHVHAFENGAGYGERGDVSAADPQLPTAGQAQIGGYLTVLGDDQVDQPMLAEIYTYPDSADTAVRIVVEAAVTKGTCGREILGETLADAAGDITMTDLSLMMPDCTAVGDILVLKNLDPDLKIASAN